MTSVASWFLNFAQMESAGLCLSTFMSSALTLPKGSPKRRRARLLGPLVAIDLGLKQGRDELGVAIHGGVAQWRPAGFIELETALEALAPQNSSNYDFHHALNELHYMSLHHLRTFLSTFRATDKPPF